MKDELEIWEVYSKDDQGKTLERIGLFIHELEAHKLVEQLQASEHERESCRNMNGTMDLGIFYDIALVSVYNTFEEYIEENYNLK